MYCRRRTSMSRRGGGGGGGRGPAFARRDIPQAEKVDTLRDALYPKRIYFNLHGLPQVEPWTVDQITELAAQGATPGDSWDDASANLVSRIMAIPAANAPSASDPMRKWGPWLPQELLETGAIRERRRRKLLKPIRRGGTVIVPEAPAKKIRVPGSDGGTGSGSDKSDSDEALSGAGNDDDDDGASGGSGDELTM
jgi:hypothetical protein